MHLEVQGKQYRSARVAAPAAGDGPPHRAQRVSSAARLAAGGAGPSDGLCRRAGRRAGRERHRPARGDAPRRLRPLQHGPLQHGGVVAQAGLLKGGRAAAAPRQAALMSAAPRLQPRPSLPAMRKEVVLATKAELAERRPSREEPLSTFDLEKLKAWGKGWTPDRGRGAAPLWLISSGVAQWSRSAESSALPVFNMQPNKLMRGWRPDCSTCTCLASEVLRRAALGCLLLRIPCPCST